MEIYKGKYFEVVYVDWWQGLPGCCIISGHKERLSDMTPDEWQELGILEKKLERVCNKLLKPTMYNFACLMNDAYKNGETPHVHFWFFPRYKEEMNICNKKFKDIHFGYNFWKWANSKEDQPDIFTNDDRLEIGYMIEKEWSINE